MSAPTIEARPSAPPMNTRLRKQRRWRVPILVIAAVVTVAVAVAAFAFLTTYRPLVPGNFGQGPVYLAGGEGRTRVTYLPGATVQWGQSILNEGRLPVTVTDVQQIRGVTPFASSSIFISTGEDLAVSHAYPGSLEPFHPFSLGPGQQRAFLYRAVFADCGPPPAAGRTTVAFSGFIVTYRTLGISHTEVIPGLKGASLRVDAPGGGC